MRRASFITTVALLLLIPIYPRAQAPVLNREVPPTLPIKQVAYIRASNAETLDHFGCGGGNQGHTGTSIAISGDANTMAVGAPFESGGSKGINGNQNDNSVYAAGAVYVYTRQGNAWTQQAYVKASNPGLNDHFGSSVALSRDGNTMAVAAHWEASAATGINGNQNDDSIPQAGAVYVFTRTGTTWTQQAYVKAPNTTANVQFGYSVALSADGNTFAVSAFDEGGASRVVVNGPNGPFPAGRNGTGAIYVYTRSGTTWALQSYLKASNAEGGDSLGVIVSISDDGNTVAGGILDEDCMSTGVNPSNPCDNDQKADTSVGAAVVFVRQGTQWAQQAFIKASNTGKEDWFGSRLQISGDGNTLAIAAQLEDSAAQGINGKQDDDSAQEAGAVYFFTRSGTSWAQKAYVKSSNDEAFDEFGSSVALSRDGRTLAVGARGEDSGAKGIDGNQADNSMKEAGAVYVFTYNPSSSS